MQVLSIGITGSRHDLAQYRRTVRTALSAIPVKDNVQIILKHGEQTGVDTYGDEYAFERGWTIKCFPADWTTYGRKAGPIRNREMLRDGVDILFAFPAPDSIGTWDCINAAVKEFRIPVRIYPL